MKKINIISFVFILAVVITTTGCYKLQKDYKFDASVLDPHINITAYRFLDSRGINGIGSDTVFKLMQLGIQYAGIDTSEYTAPGRTYIFLYNTSIRTLGTVNNVKNQTSGGFFFNYPVVAKDVTGKVLKSKLNATQDSLRPATQWSDYPQQFVKNYFLYLILQGDYGFNNLTVTNTSIQTLLPAGTVADPKETKLGWVITQTVPNPDAAYAATITFSTAQSATAAPTGFDPEGKINLRLSNTQYAAIQVNDRTDDRSAGYIATNGQVHVFGVIPGSTSSPGTVPASVHPFRYSY